MKRVTAFATAAVLALIAVFSLTATAQQPDTLDKTIMTFSAPVELPGKRLEAGTYVFKLADLAGRNVIQVFADDEKDILGQWFFVPANRQEPTEETIVTFREAAAGTTPAVQYWFYPGKLIGREFIYPKDQAMVIAQRTGQSVLTEDGRVNAEGPVAANSESQQQQSADATPHVTPAPEPAPAQEQASADPEPRVGVVDGSGLPADDSRAVGTTGQAEPAPSVRQESPNVRQESTIAQNSPRPQQADDASARDTSARELPATASPLALSGLLGLLSFAGAMGIRAFRL